MSDSPAEKALQNVKDWEDRARADGFSVEARVVGEIIDVGDGKAIECVTEIPFDMLEHLKPIFKERDRLAKEHVSLTEAGLESPFTAAFNLAIEREPQTAKWPLLHALVLPTAIQNIRDKLKETASHG